jgi:hypothetical protein
MARTGRRPGASGTRERILAAARSDFGKTGYERTTIRGIAAQARVDPALVMHYFESKDGVFRAAVTFPSIRPNSYPGCWRPAWPQLRAALVASQLVGLAMIRYSVKVEPLASASTDDLVAWLGPTLQRYLTDPKVTKGDRRRTRRPSSGWAEHRDDGSGSVARRVGLDDHDAGDVARDRRA